MSRPTTAPEALRTLRQRGSVAMGWIALAISGGMAVVSLVSGQPSLVFIGCMLLVAAVSWVLFVRPSVVLTMVGVELNNPVRRTHIPWSLVDDVAARWNLEVWSGDKAYAAWAIASHIERPAGRSSGFAFGRLGAYAAADAAAAPKPSPGATVGSASRLIEAAKGEWSELVAEGDSAVVTDGELTREWDWLDVACLAVPALLLVLGLVF